VEVERREGTGRRESDIQGEREGGREGGRVTLVVADDEDVLDLEHMDRVLQHGKEGHVRVHHQVRDIPRHED
jgi:hypothetical protein